MIEHSLTKGELGRLFSEAIDGTISNGDLQRLQACLKDSSDARKLWLEAVEVEAGLLSLNSTARSDTAYGVSFQPDQASKEAFLRGNFRVALLWAALIAVAALIAYGNLNMPLWNKETVAQFGKLDDALWAVPDQVSKEGDAIPRGARLELLAGTAEIVFRSGALVKLHSPAILRVCSENSAFLTIGAVSASCRTPASKGFSVQTPSARVVDMGTEFETSAVADGASWVRVNSGEVRVHLPLIPDAKRLFTGDSFSAAPDIGGTSVRIESGDGSAAFNFPSIEPPSESGNQRAPETSPRAQIVSPKSVFSQNKDEPNQQSGQTTFQNNAVPCSVKSSTGRIIIDLGAEISVTKLNAFLWERPSYAGWNRPKTLRCFTLFGATGEADFQGEPERAMNTMTKIAKVNVDDFFSVGAGNTRPDQQACSFTASSGCLGSFRYLVVMPDQTPPAGVSVFEALSAFQFDIYSAPWSF